MCGATKPPLIVARPVIGQLLCSPRKGDVRLQTRTPAFIIRDCKPPDSLDRPLHPQHTCRDLDQAVKILSQAIQLEPENEKNHYKRYRAHLRGKKYREALSDLSHSITLDPENGQKLAQRAKCVFVCLVLRACVLTRVCNVATDRPLSSNHPTPRLFKMMGRCGDAVADFDKAATLGGGDDASALQEGLSDASRCQASMAEADRLMAAGQWAPAREHLDVAVALTEVAPDLLLRRARCQYELGDFYSAAADTGRAIKVRVVLIRILRPTTRLTYSLSTGSWTGRASRRWSCAGGRTTSWGSSRWR